MDKQALFEIVKTDPCLCNARKWGDLEAMVGHINAEHSPSPAVTMEQVKAAYAELQA